MTTATHPKNPLILILGATGTGKSNLAIQIAQSLSQSSLSNVEHGFAGAEIVNADAMQIYRGLPIITNKVTAAEQQGVPHHLLGHIGLEEEPWTVQKYVKEADRVINEIQARRKLPIVVGGTSYYVQGLLFRNALLEEAKCNEDSNAQCDDDRFGKNAAKKWPILAADTSEIYSMLQDVDPEMASRWHPNDRRKIQRSLEIYLRSGRKASDIYQEQSNITSQNALEFQETDTMLQIDTLKYEPLVFWLEAEDQVLKERLNQRVDAMIENGLLDEAHEMATFVHEMHLKSIPLDLSKGIWVSIGYKEIVPWINALDDQGLGSKDQKLQQISCIEAVKAATRQYAKRQNRFIRLRFAKALTSAQRLQNLFLLDCTDLSRWQENVFHPALHTLTKFLEGEELPVPSSLSELARRNLASPPSDNTGNERIARQCDICDKVLMTEREWTVHVNSRSHKRALQGVRKEELNQARIAAMQSTGMVKPAVS